MAMKNKFNIADFYILLFLINEISGSLINIPMIGVIALSIILVISIYSAYEVLNKNLGGKYFKALSVLMIMFTIYGFALIVSEQTHYVTHGEIVAVGNRVYLKVIAKSLLPIYSFYVFSLKGLITEKKLRLWIIVFFVVVTDSFFVNRNYALIRAVERGSQYTDETVTNAGYLIVELMPCLVLFRNKRILFFSGLGYCVSLTMLGMKRGAIIIGFICLLFLLFRELKGSKRKEKFRVAILMALFMAVIVYYLSYEFSNSVFLQYQIDRTMEGDSSSRGYLYATLFDHFIHNDNIFQVLFGMGADGTLMVADNYAHNDWLEILTNQGAIGFLIYVYYWVSLIKEWRKSKGMHDAYMAITLFVIIFFMKTLFSMSYNTIPYYSSIILGFYLAKVHTSQIQTIITNESIANNK